MYVSGHCLTAYLNISTNKKHLRIKFKKLEVNGPFVQTFCIEKDTHMDAI